MKNYTTVVTDKGGVAQSVDVIDRDDGKIAYRLKLRDSGGSWTVDTALEKAGSLARELTNAIDGDAEQAVLNEFDDLFRD